MSFRGRCMAVVGLALLLGGCVTQQQQVANKEDLLSAAGFTPVPANTPSRVTMLQTLPPEKFVQQQKGDGFIYLFSDPLDCSCLYIGDQAAYGRYHSIVLQRQIASEQLMAAQINQNATWDWGAWGPGWWY
jgi:hypothetical protein